MLSFQMQGPTRIARRFWMLPAVFAFCAATALSQDAARVVSPPTPAANSSTSSAAPIAASENLDDSQRLVAGDLIEVSVYNVPELNTKTRVSNSGEIYLPLIGYVGVSGLTSKGAQAKIEQLLTDGGFVKNPHVAIVADQSTSQTANILGEVVKPGVYPVIGQPNLLDMISAAGGFTERAGRTVSIIRRGQQDNPIVVPLNRNITDSAKDNVPIHSGDLIVVRKADVVYVVGDVGRPSGFLMDSGHMTVLQAIALAGGTTRTAKLSGAKIIRKGTSGSFETPVQLQKVLEAKAPDPQLQAEDILFVPSSAGKILAGRTMEAAMQAATAVSIIALQ